MTLALLSTLGSNFIKDFPAANTANCDSIDTYAGPCTVGAALTGYTPQLHATSSDPILGTGGFTRGYYYRIWDAVYTWGEFRFGSAGTNIGSGNYFITLPLPADISVVGATSFPGGASLVGNGLLWDQSTDSGKRPLVAQLRSGTDLQFHFPVGETSEVVASGSAVTWTNGDGVSWFASYKRVP